MSPGPAVETATSCNLPTLNVPNVYDQIGTPRPRGGKCDLGAIEFDSDYIFADGFGH